MLLSFTAGNFKAFRESFELSLVPASRQKGLNYSIIRESDRRGAPKALSAAVIYGPNASGKTNVIEAMDVFRSLVLRGNLRNVTDKAGNAVAESMLELLPHRGSEDAAPVRFGVKFAHAGRVYEYSVAVHVGRFLEHNAKRYVVSETLRIDGKPVFDRNRAADGTENLEVGNLSRLSKSVQPEFNADRKLGISFAKGSLVSDELFLSNGFKSIASQAIAQEIEYWFEKMLIAVPHGETIATAPAFTRSDSSTTLVADRLLNDAVQVFGLSSDRLDHVADGENTPAQMVSCFGAEQHALPAALFESSGTVRLANLLPLIITALARGSVLAVDELDTSLHPTAFTSIVNIFHNDEINQRGAQLILNAHNPMLLDANVMRRDEINLVEKTSDRGSVLHSLSDFSTQGKAGVRKHENWLDNYFRNKYGAIMDLDFSDAIEKELRRIWTGGQ